MVVQHSRQEVVGRADGVEIPGEVKVDILHGHHLGIASPGGSALDAENRPQRGLPQGHHGVFANPPQAVRQTDRGGGLALPGGRGRDGGDQNQLAVGLLRLVPQQLIVNLCLIIAVLLQVSPVHACNPGNLGDVLGGTRLGNLNVGFHGQFHYLLSYGPRESGRRSAPGPASGLCRLRTAPHPRRTRPDSAAYRARSGKWTQGDRICRPSPRGSHIFVSYAPFCVRGQVLFLGFSGKLSIDNFDKEIRPSPALSCGICFLPPPQGPSRRQGPTGLPSGGRFSGDLLRFCEISKFKKSISLSNT